jgi:TPP-dependent pyruvate/acetoin dehydrogenase alpha subunit
LAVCVSGRYCVDKAELIAFEKRVAEAFERAEIKGPVHLSGGNEDNLIGIFKHIHPEDFVFSTYRNHYHALLHGLDPEWLFAEIKAGRSMNITSTQPKFFTSAIVGGTLSIAVGVAAALKRKDSELKVWCFVGDMAETIGAFHDAHQYAMGHDLPIHFVIEDNGLSCDTPTHKTWGLGNIDKRVPYRYKLPHPHVGTGTFVQF